VSERTEKSLPASNEKPIGGQQKLNKELQKRQKKGKNPVAKEKREACPKRIKLLEGDRQKETHRRTAPK